MTGMLSKAEIYSAYRVGDIIVAPFNERNLGPNSYDVRLGEWFYREQVPDLRYHSPIYNIYDPLEVQRVWGEPWQAPTLRDCLTPREREIGLTNIPLNAQVIMLEPGETVLCHTQEFIGGRVGITTMMKARSSFGRNFIEVCKCAGMGDVGYFNRWTMEVTNNSRHSTIPLVVGRRIAQITFLHVGPNRGQTLDYAKGGKYQETSRIDELVASWKPEMMLPRLYNDWEIKEKAA